MNPHKRLNQPIGQRLSFDNFNKLYRVKRVEGDNWILPCSAFMRFKNARVVLPQRGTDKKYLFKELVEFFENNNYLIEFSKLIEGDELIARNKIAEKLLPEKEIEFRQLQDKINKALLELAAINEAKKAADAYITHKVNDKLNKQTGFVDEWEIKARVGKLPDRLCGIYFLFEGHEIVYVGQSVNIINRVYTHIYERDKHKVKIFDRFTYILYPEKELFYREAEYIKSLSPKYNFTKFNIKGHVPQFETVQ